MTMVSLVQPMSFVLTLAFLLHIVPAELKKSELTATTAVVNKTTVASLYGISQQRGNTSDEHASLVRQPKAREVDSYQNLDISDITITSTDRPVSLAIHSSNGSDNRVSTKTASLSHLDATKPRRSTHHRKHANHQYSVSHSERESKPKVYATNEDYPEQQYQNYQQQQAPDYYAPATQEYEEVYNTIPLEQSSHTGLDGVAANPHYHRYSAAQDPGYFGPPISDRPVYEEPPYDVNTRECKCPEKRQMTCDNTAAEFLALAGSLGANLWALVTLIATSSLPFIIPMLVIKLILVPIGIVKFLALIKIFFKLFIILPFFVRHIYPAFTQSFNLHDFLFQKIQDAAEQVHEHEIPRPYDEDIESRTNANGTISLFRDNTGEGVNDTSIWDLRGCPSRIACELGAFLSSSTYVHFPQKLASYLSKRADRVEARSRSEQSSESSDLDYEEEDEELNRAQQRDQAFKAFVVALGKTWSQKQCVIYSCPVIY